MEMLKVMLGIKELASKVDLKLLLTPKGIPVLVLIGVVFLFALFNPLISIPVAFIAGFITSLVVQRKISGKKKDSNDVE